MQSRRIGHLSHPKIRSAGNAGTTVKGVKVTSREDEEMLSTLYDGAGIRGRIGEEMTQDYVEIAGNQVWRRSGAVTSVEVRC